MDALEEMNGGSPIPSSLKKRRITVKIPKVASLNPSQSLNNQKQSRNPRRGHIDASNGNFIPPNGVNPAAIASTYLNSSKTGIHSSDPKRQIASKAKAPVQKTGDTSIQRIAYKHKTPQLSTSSLVNANRSVSLNSFSTNKLLIHPPTIPSNVSLHSKPASAAPAQHRSNNSLRPVHSDLKTVQRPARPASQPPSGNVANMPRPLGIAAQLGLPRSRVESALASLSSVRKTSLDSVNSISKAISPSNGKSSLRLAALPFNDQRRLPTIMEPPVKQPGLQPRMTMERPRAVVPTVRGIAAQYGSLPTASSGRSPNSYLDDESDEYASDDSFIDDTDCTSAKDYLRAVKDIHKSLHFDPNKYAKISKYDNLASMESSYRQIEKEEKLSMRLGAREDQEDMAMEAERRRRRMAKRL
ncbi:conserved hypothetical protein [Echinococcus multilocularis]|uniref:Uncharacterized protein n=1 Tax=Echinococcus multilocularis TaxID=6211 RepID=A0A068YBZ4_ECHMU|nr:conserved hypothetical protein [Echinococcus multilocularis]